ncbi:MAG: SBBP repeat-containing protein [Ignavibacteria bacterium]
MKKIIFIILLLFFPGILISQVQLDWVQRYHGPGNGFDRPNALAVDKQGNVYVTGESYGNGTNCDYVTIKYNTFGIQQWIARYNGPGNDFDAAKAIAVDDSGNLFVTGMSVGNGTVYDYATIKYNSSGTEQWVSRFNGPGNNTDVALSIALDNNGNVYVTGESYGTDYDFTTIKYSSTGVQQWVQSYVSSGGDCGYSVVTDLYGNVYVTGEGGTWSFNGWDYITIKYNSSGIQQWISTYSGTGSGLDIASHIVLDEFDNVIVTGWSRIGLLDSTSDFVTVKYNDSGVQQWSQRYNGPGNNWDRAYSLGTDSIGNVYVTGGSSGNGTGTDYVTIKYNSSGSQQWIQRYNGPGNSEDTSFSISVDSMGNVYITGGSIGNGTGSDFATVKYNELGEQQWVQRYNGPSNGDDISYAIAVDPYGNVYVTGQSKGNGNFSELATIKYSQQIGVRKISSGIPSICELSQNYPNPFNPSTTINYQLPSAGNAKLIVYDILGREVATLVNEYQQPGKYQVTWDASNYSSGVYFYKLAAGDFTDTKRMMVIK